MTAAAIRQRKLARLAGLIANEANSERLTSLWFKQAMLEAANEPEKLKIAALEVLAAIGDKPIHTLEEKKLALEMVYCAKRVLTYIL